MPEKFMTTRDVGDLIGVHHTTVRRWVVEGKLKARITLGGHRRITPADLIDCLQEHNMTIPEELVADHRQKILVVDDDKMVLNVIARGLANEDKFEVFCAVDGFEAGHKVRDLLPDIVVLDIMLPNSNGFSICKQIKSKYPDTGVIAITGHGSEEVKSRIMEAGADFYLTKPFRNENLLEIIEKLHKQRASQLQKA